MLKKLLVGATLLTICLVTTVAAHADTMTLGITTTGCFVDGNTCRAGEQGILAGTLKFFGVTDQPNALVTIPPPLTVTIGTFRFADNGQEGAFSTTFNTTITFVSPIGAGSQTAIANVSGTVVKNTSGQITIDFNNTPILIHFTNGSFLFTLNDITDFPLTNQKPGEEYVDIPWTATISDLHANPVPEPASLTLMGAGIFGLAGFLRRRFRA